MAFPAASGSLNPRNVDAFFEFSLLGMLVSGYFAVLGSGALDAPTAILAGLGLLFRFCMAAGFIAWKLPPRAVHAATIAYIGFYPIDYLFLSPTFLHATTHLIFFLSVMKLLTARTMRDYAYLKLIAFLELLAASIMSVSLTFFVFLAAFLLCSIATFSSGEVKQATEGSPKQSRPEPTVVRGGMRGFRWRLGTLSISLFAGIFVLTGGLFFLLPRTARAAFRHLVSDRYRLPGFSNEVVLGQLGEIKRSSQAVMHIKMGNPEKQVNYKWRGMTLAQFDGRKWYNPPTGPELLRVENGWLQLVSDNQRRRNGARISYDVLLTELTSDVLFMAGTPEMIRVNAPYVYRTRHDSFRARLPAEGALSYAVISFLDAESPLPDEPPELPDSLRKEYLRLPELDGRIPVLARRFTDGNVWPGLQARAIEAHLQKDFGYTLELLSGEVQDPLAYFLFDRKRGHCEYFASSMAVMLRSLGIPARVATGFAGGTYNPVSGWHVIRASDAHSWVEAWLPGRGWTTFDPTPADPNPMSHSLMSKLGIYLDAADVFWQDWVLSYDLERQITLASRMEESGRKASVSWVDQFGNWLEHSGRPAAGAAWRWGGALIVILASILGLTIYWRPVSSWLVAKWRLRRLQRGRADASDAALLYRRMLDLIRKRGVEKPAWFTAGEFVSVLSPSEVSSLVAEFTADYERLRFGGQREAAVRMVGVLERLEKLA